MRHKEVYSELSDTFLEGCKLNPEGRALFVDGQSYSYADLATSASGLAESIIKLNPPPKEKLVALYSTRTRISYTSILGILFCGRGYVPLNPKFPAERNARMLELSGVDTIVLDPTFKEGGFKLLEQLKKPLRVLVPRNFEKECAERLTEHQIVAFSESETASLPPAGRYTPSENDIAYLLFTSGSTGLPKGVGITHRNVCDYISHVKGLYDSRKDDRFSQIFDLTFDLSVHDIFLCFSGGAALYVVPEGSVMAPAKFVREHQLTMWFSVPSVVSFMSRFRMLKPGVFPSVRCSLFCGEALPASSAALWSKAAPESIVENIYGPTEATIAFTRFRWLKGMENREFEKGLVPIGRAFEGQETAVAREETGKLKIIKKGEPGELLLSGSQLSPGYWKDKQKTEERFVTLEDSKRWYRTGDLVREDPEDGLVFLGRTDTQVKIRGYRVELGEIENVIREESGSPFVCVFAWPESSEGADGIAAFVGEEAVDEQILESACAKRLPAYMVPKRWIRLNEFPLNANGKLDRPALKKQLEINDVG